MPNETKILILVDGGLVQDVLVSDPLKSSMAFKIMVVDTDCDGADPDKLMDKNEIIEFAGDSEFVSANFQSGIYDDFKESVYDLINTKS